MTQLESGQQEDGGGREKMEDTAIRHAEVERLSIAAVDEAIDQLANPVDPEEEPVRRGGRRGFTITKFGRHEDGYLHARVTPKDGKPVYVHCRFGSWMAPGTINGNPVLKEVTMPVKVELQVKARAIEKAERLALREAVRHEAVRLVDQRHGYTVEFAPDPDKHRAEYDAEEAKLLKAHNVRKEDGNGDTGNTDGGPRSGGSEQGDDGDRETA